MPCCAVPQVKGTELALLPLQDVVLRTYGSKDPKEQAIFNNAAQVGVFALSLCCTARGS